ncbi:hypothetical protein GCM10007979_14300 [Nocardioides albus]|nr:hypothetical protein GCM10007979_14300 [Nocardioides albus]
MAVDECPQCSGSVEEDPEQPGVLRCMSCWRSWFTPKACSGRRPILNSALRSLADARDLRR